LLWTKSKLKPKDNDIKEDLEGINQQIKDNQKEMENYSNKTNQCLEDQKMAWEQTSQEIS
jgi:archaellum component FlaC